VGGTPTPPSENFLVPGESSLIMIREYEDGILIEFEGSPYDVEYHDANVQIWRDKNGKIVAIDIVFENDTTK